DIIKSLKVVRDHGGWTSINYFVFPGMTDTIAEYEALRKLIIDTDLKMIQWRNFNIDPDWYLGKIGIGDPGPTMGMKQLLEVLQDEFPHLKYGYFNPPIERILGKFDVDFAH
ncbi:MAG: radical SAM protein, partial [Flavisolibacter sp.]|nr:radical SAM protein [Flavisolibacter sp.]